MNMTMTLNPNGIGMNPNMMRGGPMVQPQPGMGIMAMMASTVQQPALGVMPGVVGASLGNNPQPQQVSGESRPATATTDAGDAGLCRQHSRSPSTSSNRLKNGTNQILVPSALPAASSPSGSEARSCNGRPSPACSLSKLATKEEEKDNTVLGVSVVERTYFWREWLSKLTIPWTDQHNLRLKCFPQKHTILVHVHFSFLVLKSYESLKYISNYTSCLRIVYMKLVIKGDRFFW